MVQSAASWSRRDRILVIGMACLFALACRYDLGLPCGLALLIAAPFLFGRRAWAGEVSAYSVCNADGRRIAGTFTAEQFDAQLRGGPRPDDAAAAAPMRAARPPTPDAPTDPAVRRRRAAEAAERRLAAAGA